MNIKRFDQFVNEAKAAEAESSKIDEKKGNYSAMLAKIEKAARNKYLNKDSAKWASEVQSELGKDSYDHDTGSAGSVVFYLPEDHPEVAVHITEDGIAVHKRLSKTGKPWEDVPASYMDKDSSPIDPIEYVDLG